MTAEEEQFVDDRIKESHEKLKGLVTKLQIEEKCIALDFSAEKFEEWVASLCQVDNRVAGMAAYEWNDTVTP